MVNDIITLKNQMTTQQQITANLTTQLLIQQETTANLTTQFHSLQSIIDTQATQISFYKQPQIC
jgi:hypothetical protein